MMVEQKQTRNNNKLMILMLDFITLLTNVLETLFFT